VSESSFSPSRSRLPVVIDSDPGIDDMLALYLALNSPELDVRAISVSYGNTEAENAFRNLVEILRLAGRRMSLGVGARRPLTRALCVARETHGETGLGYVPVPPAGVVLDFMRPLERILAEQREPVTLLTLGPLTSLALALRSDAALVRAKVSRHVAMAGNLEAKGNTTKFSEFNAWCDPEALATVLAAELPTELVTLDVTRQFVLDAADVRRLGATDTARARWLFDALRFYVEFHREHEGLDGCVINDVVAVAALLDPSMVRFEPARIVVDRDDDERRGRTRVAPEGAAASVARDVNVQRMRTLLSERVFRWAAASGPVLLPVGALA
jgi:purine nucleosidase